jgi:GTP 3',8-cyclase
MIDALGRHINHLRLSVTTRCNLDCFYCHREGNLTDAEMSLEDAKRIVSEARAASINELKITGGEPLLWEPLSDLVRYAHHAGFWDIGLTTNGTGLKAKAVALRQAGLSHINIGCDTVGLGMPKNLKAVKPAIEGARDACLLVKMNMVVTIGNNYEIPDMIANCRSLGVGLQLIELIDSASPHFYSLQLTEEELAGSADWSEIRGMQGRRRYHYGDNFIELVRPDRHFCEKCNKVRVGADGRVIACLRKPERIEFTGKGSIIEACNARVGYGYG